MSTLEQTTSVDKASSETDSKCDEKTSKSLKNIIECLKYHKSINLENIDSNICEIYKEAVNDYHHLLSVYINHDEQTKEENDKAFDRIYECIDFKYDDIDKCEIYDRYHRQREKDKIEQIIKDESILFYIDMMDTIYCHFVHSYHCGFRIKNKKEMKNTNTTNGDKIESNELYNDLEMIKLKKKLSSTNRITNKEDLLSFDNSNRFVTQFSNNDNINNNNDNDDDIYDKQRNIDFKNSDYYDYYFGSRDSIDEISDNENESDSELFQDGSIPRMRDIDNNDNCNNFGQEYYYWDYYKYNNISYSKWYIDKKYKNFKEEMMNNRLYRLDLSTYNYVYYKACKLLKESDTIKSIKSDFTELALHYGIDDELPLNASNIMALIFYSDYDILSYNFRKTFKKLSFYKESDAQMKIRNREYCNWSRILRETVQCYGTMMTDSKTNTYYHGINHINNQWSFKSFNTKFFSPTSISTNLSVVISFTQKEKNGIVLELESLEIESSLRYFNLCLVSHHANLEEKIIFGGRYCLKFNSIRFVKTNENYKYFIESIKLVDDIMSDEHSPNGKEKNNEENERKRYKIIESFMENTYKFPKCILNIFSKFCNTKKRIEIDLNSLNTDYKSYKKLFVDRRTNNLILIDKICGLFKNCEKIIIDNDTKHISSRYYQQLLLMIEKINKNKNIKLRSIKIERIQFEQDQFDSSILLFKKKNWEIKIKEDIAMQYGQLVPIATLSLSKILIKDNNVNVNVNINIDGDDKIKNDKIDDKKSKSMLIAQSTTDESDTAQVIAKTIETDTLSSSETTVTDDISRSGAPISDSDTP